MKNQALCTVLVAAGISIQVFGQPAVPATNPSPNAASGVVFHDRNGNLVRDSDEPGIEGVAVSNGVDVVATNAVAVFEESGQLDDWRKRAEDGSFVVPGSVLPNPTPSTHIWMSPGPSDLAPGRHRVDVEATDMFGRRFTDYHSFRIASSPPDF